MSSLRTRVLQAIEDNNSFTVARGQINKELHSPSVILSYEYWLKLQMDLIEAVESWQNENECGRLFFNIINNHMFISEAALENSLPERYRNLFSLEPFEDLIIKYENEDIHSPLHLPPKAQNISQQEMRDTMMSVWTSILRGQQIPVRGGSAGWRPTQQQLRDIREIITLDREDEWYKPTMLFVSKYKEWCEDNFEKLTITLRMVADPIDQILYFDRRQELDEQVQAIRERQRVGGVGWLKKRGVDFEQAKQSKTSLKQQMLSLCHKYRVHRMQRFIKGYKAETAKGDRNKLIRKLRILKAKLLEKSSKEKETALSKFRKQSEKSRKELATVQDDKNKFWSLRWILRDNQQEKQLAQSLLPKTSRFSRKKSTNPPEQERAFKQASANKTAAKKNILIIAHKYGVNRTRRTSLMTGYTTDAAINDLRKTLQAINKKRNDLSAKRQKIYNKLVGQAESKTDNWGKEISSIEEDMEEANRIIVSLLKATTEKANSLQDVRKGASDIKLLSKEIKKMNIQFRGMLEQLRKVWVHIKTVKTTPEKRTEQLAMVQEQIQEHIGAMMTLLERRELLNLEVKQLEKTLSGKMNRGMKVICGFTKVTYPKILWIGNLVAGEPKVKTAFLLNSPALISDGSNFAQDRDLTSGLTFGKDVFATGIAKHIKDFGTGELKISLSLGLAYGLGETGFFEAGVAFVYTATIHIDDDRKFRATGSITIQGKIKGGHKAVLEAAAEVDLVNESTTFTFNDVYHWAAWLSLKWANTAAYALALGANVYENNRIGTPTKEEADYLRMLAEVYAAESKTIGDVFRNIEPFMNEPVVRADAIRVMNISGSVTLGSMIGVDAEKSGKPVISQYYRRYTKDGALKEDANNKAKSKWWSFGIQVGNFAPAVKKSIIEFNPNPDNDGKYLTFELKVGSKERSLIGSGSSDNVPQWVTDLNEDLDIFGFATGEDTGPLFVSESASLVKSGALSHLELNCVEVPTLMKNGQTKKKWRIQYMRGVHSKKISGKAGIPIVAAPGLKVTFSGSFSLKRTYGEVLFPETMTYLHTVYNGFAAIKANEVRNHKNGQDVIDDSGQAKWHRFKKNHRKMLWILYKRLKSENSPKPARKEVEATIKDNDSIRSAGEALLRTPTDQTLERYLIEYNKKVWAPQKESLWVPHQRKVQFHLNPAKVVKDIRARRTQKGRLQHSERRFKFQQ